MTTLVPQSFLRVADKFYPRFIDMDREVGIGPSHLYTFLFGSCYHTGECSFPMETLAAVCKGSERTARNYIKILRQYGYIAVQRDWTSSNGRNVYRLLKSPRLMSLLKGLGYDSDSLFLPENRQNMPVGAADSASPSYKEDKREEKSNIPPLSPLPATSKTPPETVVSRTSRAATSCMEAPRTARGTHSPDVVGRGDFLSRPKRAETPEGRPLCARAMADSKASGAGRKRSMTGTIAGNAASASLPALFDRLWQAWPVKQGRLMAERIFCSLARAGRLPGIDALLGVVERNRCEDSRWQRGYVPLLSNWLRGERWNDEPFRRDGAVCCIATSSGAQDAPVAQELPSVKLAPEERAKVDEAGSVFDTFSALWPSEARGRICAALCRARARGLSPENLLARARESMGGAMPPPTFGAWLEGVYA